MNLALTESELTELTNKLSQFTALIDQYNVGRVGDEKLLQEVARFKVIDWHKENLFNQMLGYFAPKIRGRFFDPDARGTGQWHQN